MATGHRTMDTRLYFEGELIDAATNKPVIKVVRQGEGKDLNNESTPMASKILNKLLMTWRPMPPCLTLTKSSSDAPSLDGAFYPVRRKTPSFRAGI
ncbi:putative lipoprotein [Escherichia coli]|nr:putative lipoprotein [Escherichia coli]